MDNQETIPAAGQRELRMKELPAIFPSSAEELTLEMDLSQDPSGELRVMVGEALAFLRAWSHREEPRWLSLLGKSGTGKTFLADQISQHWKARYPETSECWNWDRVVNRYMRRGQFGVVDHLVQVPHLVLDDIGAEYRNELSMSALFQVLTRRLGKWTVLTSNFTAEQIADQIDCRIASRMVRGESRVVTVRHAPDYCLSRYES